MLYNAKFLWPENFVGLNKLFGEKLKQTDWFILDYICNLNHLKPVG